MVEWIEQFFLETVGRELCVLFCSLLPIIECRGAVPLGWALGLPWWQTGLLSMLGNLLPVPFILLFIRAVLRWMAGSRVKFFAKVAGWLDRKVQKHKGTIEKYSYLGIIIFIAVPLPGTGAWTGTLIASVLGLEPKRSFLCAVAGVLIAIVIMTVFSYCGLGAIF